MHKCLFCGQDYQTSTLWLYLTNSSLLIHNCHLGRLYILFSDINISFPYKGEYENSQKDQPQASAQGSQKRQAKVSPTRQTTER